MQPEAVAINAKAANLPDRHGGNIGKMAKGFPLMNITEMDFNGGNFNGTQGIPNGHTGVGIGGGVNDNALILPQGFLDGCHQFPLTVGLERG